MLRDLSALTTGGRGILGTHLVGILASDMPTGFAQPGLLNNDVSTGDPAGCLYRVEITSWPSAGMLAVDENGAFSFTGAPDGTYAGTERVYKNGAADTGSYSLTIGSGAVVTPPASTVTSVTLTPAAVTLAGGAQQQFEWAVAGANSPSQAVELSTTAGEIDASGLFTGPAATDDEQTIVVTATSVQDPSKSATAVVTIEASAGQDPGPDPGSNGQVIVGVRFIPLDRYRFKRGIN